MRLYLAAAVLLVALVAYAEGQDRTLEDRFTEVRDRVTSLGSAFLEKTKSTVDELANSEFAVQSKNWLTQTFEKLRDTINGQ